MGILNKWLNADKSNNKQDITKMIDNTNETEYACQKEFIPVRNEIYNQAQKTIPLRGHLNALIFTDTHGCLWEEEIQNLIKEHPTYDVVFGLGDIEISDWRLILKYIPKDIIYAVSGNHDQGVLEECQINNINGKIVEINGIRIAGFQGSYKYKNRKGLWTQKESVEFLNQVPKADILVCHDGQFLGTNDCAHRGLIGIDKFVCDKQVSYMLHGHNHEREITELSNGTKSIQLDRTGWFEI